MMANEESVSSESECRLSAETRVLLDVAQAVPHEPASAIWAAMQDYATSRGQSYLKFGSFS